MKRILIALGGMAVALSLTTAATGAIRIDKISFDSPGSDNGSNSSLNNEWIRLKNTGDNKKSLQDWKIRDKSGHVYSFGSYKLGAGKTVTIHTGDGSNSARDRYWRMDGYVWNNDGDKATLKKPNGSKVDSCSYSGAGSTVNC